MCRSAEQLDEEGPEVKVGSRSEVKFDIFDDLAPGADSVDSSLQPAQLQV